MSQLTTYRTEWRNPSAHDYKLTIDESEAFLATAGSKPIATTIVSAEAGQIPEVAWFCWYFYATNLMREKATMQAIATMPAPANMRARNELR
ncbi:hypothetical protein [Pseudomonas sp. Z2-11]